MKVKRVVQQDEDGCGIACLAIVAGVSHQDAKTALFEQATSSPRSEATTLSDLEKVLSFLNVVHRRRRFRRWQDVGDLAIVNVERAKTNEVTHWVVSVRRSEGIFVIDPAPGVRAYQRDLRFYRGGGMFIEITSD